MFTAFLFLWLAATPTPPGFHVTGAWVCHGAWRPAPAEIVEDTGPEWSAPGALVNFCPDGRFYMATGVLRKTDAVIALGASDGLQLYEGHWGVGDQGITVDYHLYSAEIPFNGMDRALATTLTAHPQLDGRVLKLEHRPPGSDRPVLLDFSPSGSLDVPVEKRFVDCLERAR